MTVVILFLVTLSATVITLHTAAFLKRQTITNTFAQMLWELQQIFSEKLVGNKFVMACLKASRQLFAPF